MKGSAHWNGDPGVDFCAMTTSYIPHRKINDICIHMNFTCLHMYHMYFSKDPFWLHLTDATGNQGEKAMQKRR